MINTNQVSIDELRTNLAEIIGRVMYGDEQVTIKKYNREAAIIISKEEYERLKDPTKRLSTEEWDQKFKNIEKIRARIPYLDNKELDKTITEAIREVRVEKRAKQSK